jgi:hypothetical protein
MLTIYLMGIGIWSTLLTMSAGYNNAKGREHISAPTVMVAAIAWPLSIPFMIGAYLGSRK